MTGDEERALCDLLARMDLGARLMTRSFIKASTSSFIII